MLTIILGPDWLPTIVVYDCWSISDNGDVKSIIAYYFDVSLEVCLSKDNLDSEISARPLFLINVSLRPTVLLN